MCYCVLSDHFIFEVESETICIFMKQNTTSLFQKSHSEGLGDTISSTINYSKSFLLCYQQDMNVYHCLRSCIILKSKQTYQWLMSLMRTPRLFHFYRDLLRSGIENLKEPVHSCCLLHIVHSASFLQIYLYPVYWLDRNQQLP